MKINNFEYLTMNFNLIEIFNNFKRSFERKIAKILKDYN